MPVVALSAHLQLRVIARIAGGYAERAFKVPDPFYHIPETLRRDMPLPEKTKVELLCSRQGGG